MRRSLFSTFALCCFFISNAQTKNFWKPISLTSATSISLDLPDRPNEGIYEIDTQNWNTLLSSAKGKTPELATDIITLPNTDGKMEQFRIWENSSLDPALQAKYPSIQSFAGKGITDPTAMVYFSASFGELQTMVLRNNAITEFIEPIQGSPKKYILYRSDKKSENDLPLYCTTKSDIAKASTIVAKPSKIASSDRMFRTMRLALSCNAEYTAYHGGTIQGALAAMNATITRVNGIFNRDFALKLVIIANNDKIIYTNPATDPYAEANKGNWHKELENDLNSLIGEANYDIGHLLSGVGGGGFAGCIGCVCDSGKGSAYTASGEPKGNTFDVDYVAHELGHQLGGSHTFSYDVEGAGVSVEPGSGSTIMGYAGITDFDIQSTSDDYFVYASINQIQENLSTKTCPVKTSITVPVFGVNAGIDYVIPKATPFVLKGATSGTVDTSFTYVWEQNDSAVKSNGANSFAVSSKIDGPLFRSIPPSTSLTRYFPSYDKVLVNKLSTQWESLSTIGRTLTFVFTARNNAPIGNGQTASDEMSVVVSDVAGPFEVTSQNNVDLNWAPRSNQDIKWNVNSANTLTGAANVNIKLSIDGGLTFPINLATNTPNDGSERIRVPTIKALNCRILVEPTNSIFYAINSTPFSIGYTNTTLCNTYKFETPFDIPDGVAEYYSKEIIVPADTGIITNVSVNVALSHSYTSDVELELVSPQKVTVRLIQDMCKGKNTSLSLQLDDRGNAINCPSTTFQVVNPKDLLSSYNTKDPAGTWLLRVRDNHSSDSGIISQASVTICTQKSISNNDNIIVDNLKVYPNPSLDANFKIEFFSDSDTPIQVSVVNSKGEKIYLKEFESTPVFNETINLGNAPMGIYIITVTDGSKKEATKVILKN